MEGEEAAVATPEPSEFDEFIKKTDRLEQIAMNLAGRMPIRSLPKQEYLQLSVVPILMEGLSAIIREKPEDPVEYLAMFLIKNNPKTPELQRTIDLSEFE